MKDDTSIHQRDSDTKTATTVQQQVKKKKKSDHENIKTNKSKKSTQSQSSVRKRSINPHITELESTALYDIWSSNHDTTNNSSHVMNDKDMDKDNLHFVHHTTDERGYINDTFNDTNRIQPRHTHDIQYKTSKNQIILHNNMSTDIHTGISYNPSTAAHHELLSLAYKLDVKELQNKARPKAIYVMKDVSIDEEEFLKQIDEEENQKYHVAAVHCCAHIHYNTFNVIKRDCVDV